MVYKYFNKKSKRHVAAEANASVICKTTSNQQLAGKLPKSILIKFLKSKVYLCFMDKMWELILLICYC